MPSRPNSVCLYSNVQRALSLASVVTDSRYMLYTEFADVSTSGRRPHGHAGRVGAWGPDPFRAVLGVSCMFGI